MYLFNEDINIHALLITITKSQHVRITIRFLFTLHHKFSSITQVPLCKSNRSKLEEEHLTDLAHNNLVGVMMRRRLQFWKSICSLTDCSKRFQHCRAMKNFKQFLGSLSDIPSWPFHASHGSLTPPLIHTQEQEDQQYTRLCTNC